MIVCGIAFGLLSIILSRDNLDEVVVEYPNIDVVMMSAHVNTPYLCLHTNYEL